MAFRSRRARAVEQLDAVREAWDCIASRRSSEGGVGRIDGRFYAKRRKVRGPLAPALDEDRASHVDR
jgi:hypothetical protein